MRQLLLSEPSVGATPPGGNPAEGAGNQGGLDMTPGSISEATRTTFGQLTVAFGMTRVIPAS